MIIVTKRIGKIQLLGTNLEADIPAGLKVIPATNIPGDKYWLKELPSNANGKMKRWVELGLLLDNYEVERK